MCTLREQGVGQAAAELASAICATSSGTGCGARSGQPFRNTKSSHAPAIAVLGNHDYECGKEAELIRIMNSEGMKVLDGTGYERDGVGFAGTKGFVGGFGRGVLTAFGEPEIKAFVKASIDEAMKLERAMSQLRTPKRVVVLHYAPIAATVVGEAPEIYPYLGSSRLGEVVDRHGADLIVHGHAHITAV